MEPIRILLVEDVELDAELTERELKRTNLNYITKRVEEESDFINQLETYKPDIILADHSLPNFDGVTALKITLEKSPETPFIFVSGKIGEDFAVEMLKRGATDYVLKSNLPKLGHAVQRALKEFNEQVELKNAQEALLVSEKKYRTLFEKNKHPIIVFDDKGNFTNSNEAALMFMETDKSDFITKNLSDFVLYSDDVDIIGSEEFWNKKDDNLEVTFEIKEKLKILELTLTPVYLKNETIVFGVGTDITKRKRDEEKILNSLKEKELLLREIHHRVKNNLQIISTLLTLQSTKNNNVNVDDLYKESQNRIQSISLIHENLYHSKDLANINFEVYAKGLITDLFDSYGVDSQKVRLNLDIDDVTMGIETAIPCGLIINELVSNSLKHGFSGLQTGEINVKLHRLQDGEFSLIVSDTGNPFPESVNLVNNETLGLELIKNLVNQLDAQLKFDRNKKEFNIFFKELEYKERI